MVIVSVEVSDQIAKKFTSYDVIPMNDLYDEIDTHWEHVIDFGKQGVSTSDILSYMSSHK